MVDLLPDVINDVDLAKAMADAVEQMSAADGLAATARIAAEAAVRLIPGAADASVSLAKRATGIQTVGSTGPVPSRADDAQVATQQGPCIEVAWDPDLVERLPDTHHPVKWPLFCARAARLGVGSMLAFQMMLDEDVDDERIGALNCFNPRPHAFTETSEEIGRIFVVHASVAVAFAEREEQMRDALAGRDVIGQAKGLLMARNELDADLAFELLVKRSRDTNTRLRDVAASIVSGTCR